MKLTSFFNPSSIAIVGVSQNTQKVGHLVANNMRIAGYKGQTFYVHPHEKEIFGQPVYKNLLAIQKKIDLVIFAVPAEVVISMLREVAKIGCKNVLVYAAGFKEIHTSEGDALERNLLERVEKYNLTLLGPNCIGFINTEKNINATFLKEGAPSGSIGIISQSGALGSAFVDTLNAHEKMGMSYFFSLGNKSVIDESDCLTFLGADEKTKVIGMYLEDVADGEKFRKTLSEVAQKKPVVILKGGATQEGSKAAMSHTGSLVGDDQVFEAVCRQSGAIRITSYHDFYELLKMYSYHEIPTSRTILVLSNAGGMGVLLADQLIQSGLSLVNISEKTKAKLYGAFNDSKKISIHNPIDLLGDASAFDYQKAIHMTMEEENVGAVMILLTPQANTEIMPTAEVLADAHAKLSKQKKEKKPLYPVFMGDASVKIARTFFEKHSMCGFTNFDGVPKLLSASITRGEIVSLKSPVVPRSLTRKLLGNKLEIRALLIEHSKYPFLNQYNSLKVLEYSGIPIAKTYHAVQERELELIVQKEGYPLVAKTASPDVTHKTEVKGVITDISSWEDLLQAFRQFDRGKNKNGCYVQKQYDGYELILGTKRDHTFGTVVLIGLGGIYAELMHEVTEFVYPYSYDYFAYMLQTSKIQRFVKGFRGMPALDVKSLYETSVKLAELMNLHKEISEIDINPLIVSKEGQIVVDARIIRTHSG